MSAEAQQRETEEQKEITQEKTNRTGKESARAIKAKKEKQPAQNHTGIHLRKLKAILLYTTLLFFLHGLTFISPIFFFPEPDEDAEKTQSLNLPEITPDQVMRKKIQNEYSAALNHEGMSAHTNAMSL